jgi:hypothetical protein
MLVGYREMAWMRRDDGEVEVGEKSVDEVKREVGGGNGNQTTVKESGPAIQQAKLLQYLRFPLHLSRSLYSSPSSSSSPNTYSSSSSSSSPAEPSAVSSSPQPFPPGYIDLRYKGLGFVLDLGWRRTETGMRWEVEEWRDATRREREEGRHGKGLWGISQRKTDWEDMRGQRKRDDHGDGSSGDGGGTGTGFWARTPFVGSLW